MSILIRGLLCLRACSVWGEGRGGGRKAHAHRCGLGDCESGEKVLASVFSTVR